MLFREVYYYVDWWIKYLYEVFLQIDTKLVDSSHWTLKFSYVWNQTNSIACTSDEETKKICGFAFVRFELTKQANLFKSDLSSLFIDTLILNLFKYLNSWFPNWHFSRIVTVTIPVTTHHQIENFQQPQLKLKTSPNPLLFDGIVT